MRHLVSVLSSMYWTLAAEVDGASNGFTLTRGVFQQQVQLEYATGRLFSVSVIISQAISLMNTLYIIYITPPR